MSQNAETVGKNAILVSTEEGTQSSGVASADLGDELGIGVWIAGAGWPRISGVCTGFMVIWMRRWGSGQGPAFDRKSGGDSKPRTGANGTAPSDQWLGGIAKRLLGNELDHDDRDRKDRPVVEHMGGDTGDD